MKQSEVSFLGIILRCYGIDTYLVASADSVDRGIDDLDRLLGTTLLRGARTDSLASLRGPVILHNVVVEVLP